MTYASGNRHRRGRHPFARSFGQSGEKAAGQNFQAGCGIAGAKSRLQNGRGPGGVSAEPPLMCRSFYRAALDSLVAERRALGPGEGASSTEITKRLPSRASALASVGSFVRCRASRMRRASRSSLPIKRAKSDFVIPAARTASSTASFAATSGAGEMATSFLPLARTFGNGKPRRG